jgi:hypothetical protein
MKLIIIMAFLVSCANMRHKSIFDEPVPELTRREKERRSFILCVQRFWDAGMTAEDAKEVCTNSMAFPER